MLFFYANSKSKFSNQKARATSILRLINYTVLVLLSLSIQQEVYINAHARSNGEPATDPCVKYTGSQKYSSPQPLDATKSLAGEDHNPEENTAHPKGTNSTKNFTLASTENGSNGGLRESMLRLRRNSGNLRPGILALTGAQHLNEQHNLEQPSIRHSTGGPLVAVKLGDLKQVSQELSEGPTEVQLVPPPRTGANIYNEDAYNLDNPGTSESANRGETMVFVASKAGQLDKIAPPLADLIGTQTTEATGWAQGVEEPQFYQEDSIPPQEDLVGHVSHRPSLAELIAANTAMGIQIGNLARTGRSNPDQVQIGPDGTTTLDSINHDESRNIDQSSREQPLETAMEREMPERAPESMESLVRSSEQDDLVNPVDENDQSASNLVQGDDDDDYARWPERRSSVGRRPRPASLRRKQQPEQRDRDDIDDQINDDDDDKSYDAPLEAQEETENRRKPAVSGSRRNSNEDLKAAAGHYYGKMKKKKKKVKVVKKKKKIVIKKIKKYKVKKYKVKVIKKKKKKKYHHGHHHGHGHGHDHGKYYMYAKVPKKKSWEFGFKRGNKKHWIERHEKGHKNKFKTKVKWYDKKSKGKGVHIWDYNHFDKKKYHG